MSQRTRVDQLAQPPDLLGQHAIRPDDPVSLTDGAHLVVVPAGQEPVGSFAQFRVPLHQFLVSCICLALLIDAHRPDGLVRVGHGGLRGCRWALRGSRIRRVCRNRNCWCCRCDANTDHGNQGGLHWSSSCRWSLSVSPHFAAFASQSPPSHDVPRNGRPTAHRRPVGRFGRGKACSPQSVAASLTLHPSGRLPVSRGSGARWTRRSHVAVPIDRAGSNPLPGSDNRSTDQSR